MWSVECGMWNDMWSVKCKVLERIGIEEFYGAECAVRNME